MQRIKLIIELNEDHELDEAGIEELKYLIMDNFCADSILCKEADEDE